MFHKFVENFLLILMKSSLCVGQKWGMGTTYYPWLMKITSTIHNDDFSISHTFLKVQGGLYLVTFSRLTRYGLSVPRLQGHPEILYFPGLPSMVEAVVLHQDVAGLVPLEALQVGEAPEV